MSPVGLEHETNYTPCHHCHLTSPIPLSELIKTHPLRSIVARKTNAENANLKSSQRKREEKIYEEADVQSLLEEVTSNEYRLRKLRSTSSTSDHSSPSRSLSRKSTDTSKFVKPVHSYLHHVSHTSAYKGQVESSTTHNNSTINSKQSRTSSHAPISAGVILDPQGLEPLSNHSTHSRHYSSIRKDTKLQRNLVLKDIETQTSKNNSILNGQVHNGRPSGSDVSLLTLQNRKYSKRKKCDKFFCSLPSVLLFAGYALLIVIGIVIAVALSQRERRISLSSALPQRPVSFSGARPAPAEQGRIAIRTPPTRKRISAAIRKAVRPDQSIASRQNVAPIPTIKVPAPFPQLQPQPQPRPPVAGVPLQIFRDDDFDYFNNVGFNDQDFLLPKPNVQPQPQPQPQPAPQPTPTQKAFRPVEIQPQFRPQAPIPSSAQEVRTVARVIPRQQESAPRRTIPNTFKQEFNIDSNQGNTPRGQREPAVKIVKSWSNRNADGTFSWGYINTDGSFKNETKGADCVVRGVYGYVDKDTGETLTFPYVSGNPCDPNEPDYYYDYEEGTINSGGKVVNRQKKTPQVASARRP